MSRSLIPLLALAALASGCNKDYPNPFEEPNPTATPRPDADLVFTSNTYASAAGAPREVFAVRADGADLTRLTFCNAEGESCDNVEAAFAADHTRVAIRKVTKDTDGNGQLTADDGEGLFYVDLGRNAEGRLLPDQAKVSGVDWSPSDDILVYSAVAEGGLEDLFRVDSNGQQNRALTFTPSVRERRPRIDPSGGVAVFERIASDGKGQIWIFHSGADLVPVTPGGPGSGALPGTSYVVGSDADPSYSPDGRSLAFRRLTGVGNGGLGSWDVLTVGVNGSSLAVVASGPAYRGAPDWGPKGIVFNEVDLDAGASLLVIVQPDGSGRRVPVALASHVSISFPRWLR